MKLYGHFGYRRFVLCLGYNAWDIKQYFLRYEEMTSDLRVHPGADTDPEYLQKSTLDDWEVTLMDTGMETGTGAIGSGGLPARRRQFHGDLRRRSWRCRLRRPAGSAFRSDYLGMVTGVDPTSRYGKLGANGIGMVTDFAEKPPSAGWVSGGFFAFRREFLGVVPTDEPSHFFEKGRVIRSRQAASLGCSPIPDSGWGWTRSVNTPPSMTCGPAE